MFFKRTLKQVKWERIYFDLELSGESGISYFINRKRISEQAFCRQAKRRCLIHRLTNTSHNNRFLANKSKEISGYYFSKTTEIVQYLVLPFYRKKQ